MRLLAPLLLLLLSGCSIFESRPLHRGAAEAEMFGPASMNFQTFTAVKNLETGEREEPNGIDVSVEFVDQFGDPTKASGSFIFELYDYQRADPDPRGLRIARWPASIQSLLEQRARWSRISRTYSFPLRLENISAEKTYVLTAIFQSTSGGRLFARTILEPPKEEPTTQPSTQPSTQPATRPTTNP